MKMTVSQAILAAEAIASMRNKALPVRASYALGKSFTALAKERQTVDEERMKLCRMYAEKDENGEPVVDGNVFKMTTENEAACNAEYAKLLATETEVDVCQVPITLLEAADQDKRYDSLTIRELDAISMLITEE